MDRYNPMTEDEDQLDPLTGAQLMPNVPRDPNDPREKLKSYLAQRMEAEKKMASPEYRDASRAPQNELMQSNRDLALQKLLQQSANQFGTIGGKAASSQGSDQYLGELQNQNQQALQGMDRERMGAENAEGQRLKMMQYLADKFDSREQREAALQYRTDRDTKTDEFRTQSLAAQKGKTAADASGKDADRVLNLSTKYGDEENVKRLNNYRDSLANAEALSKNPSPANDTSLLYQYVKANDPNTGVKDMELQIASRSGPIWDRVKGYMEGMQSGLMLPDKRAQIMEAIRTQANAAEQRVQETERTYEDIARNAKVDPNLVIGGRRSRYKEPAPKIKITNGKEEYFIDAADLKDAEADGFKAVQ